MKRALALLILTVTVSPTFASNIGAGDHASANGKVFERFSINPQPIPPRGR